MQAERWRQIERLFHSALERALGERAALLAEACAGDEELRREVESLLAEHARGGSLLETAAADLEADWAQEYFADGMTEALIAPGDHQGRPAFE